MNFVVPLGLLVAALVVGPLVAHLLRRRRPEERAFPPARFVPTAPPVARRRAHLEDRSLLAIRAIAIIALALLAASPLVRCNRLALDRRGGASIALAIVVDDSMSMRAELADSARRGGAKTRYELAIVAARELAGSLRSGDVTTIVMAGAPARVFLAPTQEPGVVRAAVERLAQEGAGDRATDLDGAIAVATAALAELPQPDRRVVLLSDLADGNPNGPALNVPDGKGVRIEAPIEALRAPPKNTSADCAVLAATPEADAVRVKLACAGLAGAGKRAIEIVSADAAQTSFGRLAFPPDAGAAFELVVPIDPGKASSLTPADGKPRALARIVGETDAIASDDFAPVLGAATAAAIGVVVGEGGALDEMVATGGAPVLERALTALQAGVPIKPVPSTPDREVDLAAFAALAIDDPAGFGPEAHMALAKWVDGGGVLLIALGPRASSLPLGNAFEPFLQRPVRWEKVSGPLGVDKSRAGPFGDGVEPPDNLAATGRAAIDREDEGRYVVRTAFTNGTPLLLTQARGQGEVWFVTLPFAPDLSDLPVKPSFLSLLDSFVSRARDRGAGARLAIGESWVVGPSDAIEVVRLDDRGAPVGEPLTVEATSDGKRVRPGNIGAHVVTITPNGGSARKDVRAVRPAAAEVDLRPRALAPSVATGSASGLQRQTTELGPTLALALVLLAVIELLARVARLVFGAHPEQEGAVESLPPPAA
jgi:hypothetical protein